MSLKNSIESKIPHGVIVTVPIYNVLLSELEQFSLDQTFKILKDREIMFFAQTGWILLITGAVIQLRNMFTSKKTILRRYLITADCS